MLDTRRHDQLFDKNKLTDPVHVIGVGGVGSALVRQLAKLGVGTKCEFHVWDGDIVAPHNICNQAYDPADTGRLKVVALVEHAWVWGDGTTVTHHSQKVEEKVPLSGIVFLCLDSMTARKSICEQSLFGNPEVRLVIETRMDARHLVFHAFDPNNLNHQKWWDYHWFPDEQAQNDVGCADPISIINSVEIMAGIATDQLVTFMSAGSLPRHAGTFNLRTWTVDSENWDMWPGEEE